MVELLVFKATTRQEKLEAAHSEKWFAQAQKTRVRSAATLMIGFNLLKTAPAALKHGRCWVKDS